MERGRGTRLLVWRVGQEKTAATPMLSIDRRRLGKLTMRVGEQDPGQIVMQKPLKDTAVSTPYLHRYV